jgi:Na+-driven multidrug efflux pump
MQWAGAGLPAVQLAAHQAVWSMYTISSFTTATLEQAALAFLPRADSAPKRSAIITITRTLGLMLGTALGATCWALASRSPMLFTPDLAVHAQMGRIAPFCGAVMLIVGADVSATAVLISMGYQQYLARSFVLTLVAVSGFLYSLKLRAGVVGLIGVWLGLIFFFAVRCVQSYLGVALLRMRDA